MQSSVVGIRHGSAFLFNLCEMGLPRGLTVLWLACATSLLMGVGCARIADRPASGFEESGYVWPKLLIFHQIRISPGRYWLAYAPFATSAILLLVFYTVALWRVTIEGPGEAAVVGAGSNEPTVAETFYSSVPAEFHAVFLGLAAGFMGMSLFYITVVGDNLSDVLMSYLVGLCAVQVLFDSLRFFRIDQWSRAWAVGSVGAFMFAAVFPVMLQDASSKANKINFAYSITAPVLLNVVSSYVPSLVHDKCDTVVGSVASLVQLAFCIAAYVVTMEVDGVPHAAANAFFYTTVGATSFSHILSLFFLIMPSTSI